MGIASIIQSLPLADATIDRGPVSFSTTMARGARRLASRNLFPTT